MPIATYATHFISSRGRLYPIADERWALQVHQPNAASENAPQRSEFQRDRDRIVHSTAFRRLVYKTQVFLNHEGDLFRTRMTHSLEVAQLGRSIARALQLDEDLVEAIALAHDLGHTPFGHAGQDALNECMADHHDELGGFEHNLQSLRVVDELEERYPDYNGLNLTLDTREGILKHCSPANAKRLEAREPQGVARRFMDGTQPSLEAQLANIADEIAYNAHDIDDGVRSGLVSIDQLLSLPLFARFHAQVMQSHPGLQGRRVLFEVIRRMLSAQVFDVIDATRTALLAHHIDTPDDVRHAPPLVQFSTDMRAETQAVKSWLFRNLYRHQQVTQTTDNAKAVIRSLFAAYMHTPGHMPASYAQQANTARAVADYIAGMTDRFAAKEHDRLC
jgi:dGTPase